MNNRKNANRWGKGRRKAWRDTVLREGGNRKAQATKGCAICQTLPIQRVIMLTSDAGAGGRVRVFSDKSS